MWQDFIRPRRLSGHLGKSCTVTRGTLLRRAECLCSKWRVLFRKPMEAMTIEVAPEGHAALTHKWGIPPELAVTPSACLHCALSSSLFICHHHSRGPPAQAVVQSDRDTGLRAGPTFFRFHASPPSFLTLGSAPALSLLPAHHCRFLFLSLQDPKTEGNGRGFRRTPASLFCYPLDQWVPEFLIGRYTEMGTHC